MARKWRPQEFSEVIGQSHITQTLLNALKNNRLPHAILFTGPRGTGKTTSARILAKALRCSQADNFIPCQKCDSCLEIAAGHSLDVLEIDGASNNGVDAIRELRETVSYRPAVGKYKIYIIDEVHMLSTSAFNALLKTLEEPPEHVVFMMATTEVQKIPATILSRCQRFDFRKVSTRVVTQHLQGLCQKEKIEADTQALWLIARQGEGSVRDSLSLLDQVVSFANGKLTPELITEVLGLTDRALLQQALDSLVHRDSKIMIDILAKAYQASLEPKHFCEDLLESLRHLIILKTTPDRAAELMDRPDSEVLMLSQLSQSISMEDLHLLFDMLLKGLQDVLRSTQAYLVFEVVMMRLVLAPRIMDLQQMPAIEKKNNSSPQPPMTPIVTKTLSAKNPAEKWLQFVNQVRKEDGFFAAKIENLLFLGVEAQKLKLGLPQKLIFLKEQMADQEIKRKLQGLIDSLWGQGYSFDIVLVTQETTAESAQTMTLKKNEFAEKQLKSELEKHPKVMAATKVFGGSIKSVEDLKKP